MYNGPADIYETLHGWNPDILITDTVGLITARCTRQLKCLAVKHVSEPHVVSSSEISFTVIYKNDDGTTFKRGPCCGSTEKDQPTVQDFEYHVTQTPSGWKVDGLGVYVP